MKIQVPILIILLTVISCKSSKFEKTIPFQIEKATYHNWVGGQPGVKGTKIEFLIADLNDNIKLNQVYFKNRTEKLYVRNSSKNSKFTANINTEDKESLDVIMHKDANKEYGNKLPKHKVDFPFELKENECVITYQQGNKEYFYKLILTKEKDVIYP